MRFSALATAALLTFSILGCASVESQSTGKVTISDDSYARLAKVSTHEHTITSDQDVFLRGAVLKADPESSPDAPYQVRFALEDNEWHFWEEVRYTRDGTVQTVTLREIDSEVSCGGGACTHYERVSGRITRDQMQEMAGDSVRVYSGEYANTWKTLKLPEDEVSSLLTAVDSLKTKYR